MASASAIGSARTLEPGAGGSVNVTKCSVLSRDWLASAHVTWSRETSESEQGWRSTVESGVVAKAGEALEHHADGVDVEPVEGLGAPEVVARDLRCTLTRTLVLRARGLSFDDDVDPSVLCLRRG